MMFSLEILLHLKLIVAVATTNTLSDSRRNINLHVNVAAGVDNQTTLETRSLLRSQGNSLNASLKQSLKKGGQGPGCQCMPSNAAWAPPARTKPKCIFIDLGAADGNTFKKFLSDGFGHSPNDAAQCGRLGDYEALLVEANPRFDAALHALVSANPGKVRVIPSTAAYMCEGKTTFYLDTQNHDVNYWGSSMSPNHPDAAKSGYTKVTVPTLNLMKFLTENTIPGDFVILKMDIEGAEWDIVPCLAMSPIAPRINFFFVEKHPSSWSVTNPTEAQWSQAVGTLQKHGVQIPEYSSSTLLQQGPHRSL